MLAIGICFDAIVFAVAAIFAYANITDFTGVLAVTM